MLTAARSLLDLLSLSYFNPVKLLLKTIVHVKVFITFAMRVNACPRINDPVL